MMRAIDIVIIMPHVDPCLLSEDRSRCNGCKNEVMHAAVMASDGVSRLQRRCQLHSLCCKLKLT